MWGWITWVVVGLVVWVVVALVVGVLVGRAIRVRDRQVPSTASGPLPAPRTALRTPDPDAPAAQLNRPPERTS